MADFFAENLRFRKNVEKTPLQTCWCAATIKKFSTSASKEINLVDVAAVCDDMKNKFLETPHGKSRCSLYLASQLMFGVVKVFQAQTDSCLNACQNLCVSISPRTKIIKKKAMKKNKPNSLVEASPTIPEISMVDIFSLLEKNSAEDVNLIEEVEFPPDQTNDLSFQFSNDAECDDTAMEEELSRELQRILRHEKDIPPRPSTNSFLYEEAPSINNVQSPHIPDNENVMDQDQMSLNQNHIHDMRQKLQTTPIRARSKLNNINESTRASAHNVFSPLASEALSLPQSPPFAMMSPLFGKRKRRTMGRDVTIMEPITEAGLPTDSPQQSKLPMECATPPQLFSTSLEEHSYKSPPDNHELPEKQFNIPSEKEKESALENVNAVKSTSENKDASLPVEDQDSVESLSHGIARSQRVIEIKSADYNANEHRAEKRNIEDSEMMLDYNNFAKRLRNPNYLVKKKEKALIISTISSQSPAMSLLTLPCVLQKHTSISNRLMQSYKQEIKVLKKSAKQTFWFQHSTQHSENQSYDEGGIRHQSTAGTAVEENMESQQINQHFENDDMMPQDNGLNEQRLQVPTQVQTNSSDEDEFQDNILIATVSNSSILERVNSSEATVGASVTGTAQLSASRNKEKEPGFHSTASISCIPIQLNENPSQLLDTSQTARINEVSEEIDDRQQEKNQAFHKVKRFKVGGTELGTDFTDQNMKTISFLSLSDFYARVEMFWSKAEKLNRRLDGKLIAVFQEVVSPECSHLYEVLKYLIYCFTLELHRKMDLHQEKPWYPLYILTRK